MGDTTLATRNEKTDLERIIESESDERAYTYVPVRYRIASQVGRFENISEPDDLLREILGIILMSRIVRAYWPERDDSDKESRPTCASYGGINGEWHDPDGSTRNVQCASCPLNRWGSDPKGGRGKACKEMRRFLVLPAGCAAPVVLTIPPTSCKPYDSYASALKTRKSSYFAVETTIGLDRAESAAGQQYSVCTFRKANDLAPDMVGWVIDLRHQFEDVLGATPEYEEYIDGNGQVKDEADPDLF